jgi:gluconolactonase
MRSSWLGLYCFSIGALVACSNDADDDVTSGGLGGAPGAAGSEATSTAGSGGSNGSGAAGAASGGTSPGGATGASPEGVNVTGPLDTNGSAGSANSPSAGAAGGAGSGDAGLPPAATSVCPAGPFPATPLTAGAAPQVVCSGMTFTEGAVWFANLGTLFFSDFQINDAASNFDGRILSYTPGGTCEELIPGSGTNGLAIAPDGNLLGARHSDATLTLFDLTTRQPTVLVADDGGASLNAPNDIAIRSDGNLYFTDPTFLLGNRTSELPARAYRRDPSGVLSVIDEGINPNGITLSPDETKLYLSHLGGPQNDVVVFDVDPSGAVSNPQPFIDVGSDGMAIDCAGNLYITQGGVQVYDPSGNPLGTLAAPGAANVAFGGADRRTLFITARSSLLSIELAIPGLPY